MQPIGIIVLGYNQPDKTAALATHIQRWTEYPYRLIVVDNGSDPGLSYTGPGPVLRVPANVRGTYGYRLGWQYLQAVAARDSLPTLAYWFVSSSRVFREEHGDIATPLVEAIVQHSDLAVVCPSTRLAPGFLPNHYYWEQTGVGGLVDIAVADQGMIRGAWFDRQNGFHPGLTYGQGHYEELCYRARCEGSRVCRHDDVIVDRTEHTGYKSGAFGAGWNETLSLAIMEMNRLFIPQYGSNWPTLFWNGEYPG